MIYVMSDIHGHKRAFDDILKQINFSSTDTLYILGDVVDKGPSSIPLVKQIMEMDNVRMLLGNHEHMMLSSLGYGSYSEGWTSRKTHIWYRNAGRRTEEELYDESDSAQKEILEYIYNLPLAFDIEVADRSYRLVHAAPVELYGRVYAPELQDEKSFAVWYRMDPADDLIIGKTVVFGHTPTWFYQDDQPPVIWHGDHRIDLDCGCAYDGRLSCLRLDDMAEFYSDARQ